MTNGRQPAVGHQQPVTATRYSIGRQADGWLRALHRQNGSLPGIRDMHQGDTLVLPCLPLHADLSAPFLELRYGWFLLVIKY